MDNCEFMKLMEKYEELKKDLFIRGFLITDTCMENLEDFPFYGTWRVEKHDKYYFMAHALTGMHIYENNEGKIFFLMGHAYNPFTMQTSEEEILKYISEAYGTNDYLERINDITGVFVYGDVIDGKISFLVDPSGMQSACYGRVDENFYLSSHAQLVGDVCKLKRDDFVKKLVQYKWYGRVMGPYLPGDLTPFEQIKRIVPSIKYSYESEISHHRYWPLKEIEMVKNENEYQEVVNCAADILRNNMELVARKWERPWISLTGGIDSNTTFAAGNGNYEKFESFSYISAEKEVPDAEAAKRIAQQFNVKHNEYSIPNNNQNIKLFEERRELFRHNNGYIAELYDNEARKKFFLRDNVNCDVEVKSWVSETIRAYWYKHYGRKTFPKLSGKLFRNLYKIFITNRKLAHQIDGIFDEYIQKYEYNKIPESYPVADMHYNEVTWGSWGGLNISEMKYCFDITFIYNNRRFLDLMFRVPLEKRISDQHHVDMKKYLNEELYNMNIRVVNMKETRFRAFALNVIFTINSILPF